jgi:hypothetical protein
MPQAQGVLTLGIGVSQALSDFAFSQLALVLSYFTF